MSDAKVKTTIVPTSANATGHLRDYLASRMQDALNGFALTNALFAFTESKLYDELRDKGEIESWAASAERYGYDARQTEGLLHFLAIMNVLEERGPRYRLTPFGEACLSPLPLGKLRHVRGGYGELMFRAKGLLDRSLAYGKDVSRDGAWVGIASNMISSSIRDELPHKLAEQWGVRTIVDLGCGAARFLINFVKRSPHHRGIGVDISADAIEAARAEVAREGLADRIQLMVCEAERPESWAPRCSEADMIFAHAIQHEILRDGEQAVIDHIDGLAPFFRGKKYLIGEPLEREKAEPPFYWLHVLSEQGIPRSIDGWVPVFSRIKSGRLEGVYASEHVKTSAYFCIQYA